VMFSCGALSSMPYYGPPGGTGTWDGTKMRDLTTTAAAWFFAGLSGCRGKSRAQHTPPFSR
jgi:hypothetical protein